MRKTTNANRILWLYDQPIEATNGGTERATVSIMQGLKKLGNVCLDCLVIPIDKTKSITYKSKEITDVYQFLIENNITIAINQLAFDSRLLERFFSSGGERWQKEGGKLISCMHFAPELKTFCLDSAIRAWPSLSIWKKIKRVVFFLCSPFYYYKSRLLFRNGIRFCYRNSDKYVVLTGANVVTFSKIISEADASKFHVINNPLSYDSFLQEEEINEKQNIVLCVARLCEAQKRISLVLKTWEKIQDTCIGKGWELRIVGEGEDRSLYEKIIAQRKLQRVAMCGKLEPIPEYRKASIFVGTSPSEGWGLTLTEALQMGCVPVVMDSSTSFKEIITNEVDGILVTDGDCDLLATAVMSLMKNQEKRKAMARAGLKSCTRFNRDSIARKWNQLIKSI